VRGERIVLVTKRSLLTQIEDALLSGEPVADVLRKLIVFGGRVGSPQLRDWATRELRGYDPKGTDELPAYRTVPASLQLDAIVGYHQISGRQLAPEDLPADLPDDVGAVYRNEVPFHQGIGEIEALVSKAESFVKLTPPAANSLARYMDQENGIPHQQIQRIYWSVSTTAISGIVDQVKTRLAELLGELREVTPEHADTPSPDQAAHAVNIFFNGGRGHQLQLANATDNAVATTNQPSEANQPRSGWWTLGRALWGAVIGIATIAAAVIAYLQLSAS